MVASVGGEGFATRGDFAVPSARSSSIAAIPAVNVPTTGDRDDDIESATQTEPVAPEAAAPDAQQPEAASPQPAESAQSEEPDETGNVTPTLEGRVKSGKRGLVILHIG